jgi:hypothetical protein
MAQLESIRSIISQILMGWWEKEATPHPHCTFDSISGFERAVIQGFDHTFIHGHVLLCRCGRWRFYEL